LAAAGLLGQLPRPPLRSPGCWRYLGATAVVGATTHFGPAVALRPGVAAGSRCSAGAGRVAVGGGARLVRY